MKTSMELFAEFVKTTAESATQHTGGILVTKPFQKRKKATERMKAHERSSHHTQASQVLLVISKQGSVVQQLQRVGMQETEKNRAAMKYLVRCTRLLPGIILLTPPISPN